MADVRLNPQQVDEDGLTATYTGSLSVTDTYLVNNDGRTIMHFKKSGVGACVVTIDTPGTVRGLAVADRTVNVPATTGDVFCGPFPPNVYNQPATHDLKFTLSDIAGLTVAALRV